MNIIELLQYAGTFRNLDPVSISNKTTYCKTLYCKISWSLEVARFIFRIARWLWNLTGTAVAVPVKLQSDGVIYKLQISRNQDFTKSYDKTSYRILNHCPGTASKIRWLVTSIMITIIDIRRYRDSRIFYDANLFTWKVYLYWNANLNGGDCNPYASPLPGFAKGDLLRLLALGLSPFIGALFPMST